ncbi:MAG TPA: hypothetical protein VK082_06620 [Paenalcaligenes sp.]|nr:hypothetical protein [Paenalcaligenes sp.]
MSQKSFKQAYETLQKHADTLRAQQEPNIDDLLTIVTESVSAYNVCKERIDAVEAAMEQAFSRVQDDEFAAAPESEAADKADSTGVDDDIPF